MSSLIYFCQMDVSVFMNMDESPNSSKDACMVESVSSPRGDGKENDVLDIIVMACLMLMQCDKMILRKMIVIGNI